LFQRGARWPIRLGCAVFLLFGPAPLQAQVVAPLPDVPLMTGGGQVHAIVVQADGKVIIGGSFALVNGVPRRNLARLNSDGSLDTAWNPDPDGPVYALALDGTDLYVGGNFTFLGQENLRRLAAIDVASGQPALNQLVWRQGFNSDLNGPVKALAVDETWLYVGGSFTDWNVEGSDLYDYITAIDITQIAFSIVDSHNTYDRNLDGDVEVILLDTQNNNYMFVGGSFTESDQGPVARLGRFHRDGFILNQEIGADGTVRALAQSGTSLYAGGDFMAPRRFKWNRLSL
jgi:hypothetical protein